MAIMVHVYTYCSAVQYIYVYNVGFGLVGMPENLIRALRVTGPKNLTFVSNEAG